MIAQIASGILAIIIAIFAFVKFITNPD